MNKTNYFIFFLFFFLSLIIGLLIGYKIYSSKISTAPYLIINNQKILVEVADTPDKITQGLSDRPSLADNRGMLFILDKSDFHTFWMNKMQFSLDFVFIDNNQVVGLAENVPFPKLGEQPLTITAGAPFDKVLEINAGKIKEYGIKIGNNVFYTSGF